MAKDITKIFNQFAGREVSMEKTQQAVKFDNGTTVTFDVPELAILSDPTLQEMRRLANDNGLKLRFWFPPDSTGQDDFRDDRVNAYVEKAADGKYRVSKKFTVG